jgi:hypothetical protein
MGKGGTPGSAGADAELTGGNVSSMAGAASVGGAMAGGGTASGFGGAATGGVSGAATGGVSGDGGASGSGSGGATASAGSDGCNQELLQNPGFEQGDVAWLLESNFPGIAAIVLGSDGALKAEGVAPKQGSYLAWLGGIPDNPFDSYYVSISQVVELPKGTSTLTLSGYVRIKTEEPDPKETFDRAYIQLEWPDDRPDLLWLPVEWTVDQANSDWVQFSAVKTDTAQIAGQKVMLRASAETDPNLKSSFWVDSLSLVAKCGR